MRAIFSIILIFIVLFSGCIGQKEQKISNKTTQEINVSQQKTQIEKGIPDDVKPLVEQARKNLSSILNINESSIEIVDFVLVEWADSSLGYPEPGKSYEPTRITGYVITLHVGDKLYEYHSDKIKIVPPSGPIIYPGEGVWTGNMTYQVNKLIGYAKNDLATKLKIPETSIQLVRTISTEWEDSSLGYPEKGMMYTQVITPGYIILLIADNKMYEYHSDFQRVVAPPEYMMPPEKK